MNYCTPTLKKYIYLSALHKNNMISLISTIDEKQLREKMFVIF